MAATYEPIATTTLGSAAATITLSSIPSTYTDLRVVFVYDQSATATPRLTFNTDNLVSTDTSFTWIRGNGTTATSGRDTSTYAVDLSSSTATGIKFGTIDIFSYAGSTNKTVLVSNSSDNNGGGNVYNAVGLWRNTTAINQLVFRWSGSQNWTSGTTVTIYGIKSA